MKNNESSQLSIKPSSQKQSFTPKKKKQIITYLVKQWHQNQYLEKRDNQTCFDIFIYKFSKVCGLKITFDNSISKTLCEISKEIDFLQFDDNKINELKKTLQNINQVLKEKQFISQRQYNRFQTQFLSRNLQDSVYLLVQNLRQQGYVKYKFQTETSKKTDKTLTAEDKKIMMNLWPAFIGVEIETFWRFVLMEKIEHRQLPIIFKAYEQILKDMQLRDLKKEVAAHFNQWVERKRKEKLSPIRQIETSIIEYDHLLDLKAENISAYLNTQRWEKYTKQYNTLTKYLLQRCNTDKISFEPYGSFKSKFYVINYSDIDIGLYYDSTTLKKRESVCEVLKKIYYAVQAEKESIENCIQSRLYTFEKIKVPFVKIIYNNSRGYNKDVVPTMDIIINNFEGIQNSKMLALYAEDEYLLKFCNLIKYWAIKRNLINLQRKWWGLSSYGLLLMSLYFLMYTGQIPYLRKIDGEYEIGKEKFRIKNNFLDNFIEFLRFYSFQYKDPETQTIKQGQFHEKNLIVCLIEKHEGRKLFDRDIIINMYDFIDGSNPGRMRTDLIQKFKTIFQQTLKCLEDRSISFLSIIYDEQQTQNKPNEPKFARRGNRYPVLT